VRHFEQENDLMDQTDFPPRDCHKDEHAKVLQSVRDVLLLVRSGNTTEVRRLAATLKDWFPAHADYMDSALAKWMVKRTHGASPFVFRRKAA
jgi:hemerythrin